MSANYHTNSFYQWGRQGRNTPRIGALQRHENEIAHTNNILYYKSIVVCMYFSNGFRGAVVFRNVSKSQTKMSTTRRDMLEAEIFGYKFQF